MLNKKIIYGIIVIIVLVIVLATLLIINKRNVSTPWIPPNNEPQNSEKCGIENCHGLNITCGPNVPDACTEVYQLGDGCRKYAKCENVGEKCQLQRDKKFDECKACAEKCNQDFKNNAEAAFRCEANCL